MSPTSKREGASLLIQGRLDADSVPGLKLSEWNLQGVERIDLDAVPAIDSTGIALIAELVARIAARGPRPRVVGEPQGLSDLCTAYRIAPDFSDYPD
ncbi:MAG: lipid asymmetry maintenance protein MlaB [Lysobacterales bacterium]